jgi:trimeric autotransporter adhesin
MKTKILSGLICCLGIFSVNAQTITAPSGQNLTITNAVDVTGTGNSINIPSDGSFKIGGNKILSIKTTSLFLGEGSGTALTSGTYNFFSGINAGFSSTTGGFNLFAGANSGYSNTTGNYNYFSGLNSGYSNTTGDLNMFIGSAAGYSNTTGTYNSFLGVDAGRFNTTGSYNMFIGANAGLSNLTGSNNFFAGLNVGTNNTTGNNNAFLGATSGYTNTTGSFNSFVGSNAGRLNTIGSSNSFVGSNSGYSNTSGQNNTFLGVDAGSNNTTGSNNTYIGSAALGSVALTNATAIGANALVTTSNTVVLGNAAITITGQGLSSAGIGSSGLKFASLNSTNNPTVTGNTTKVLSVDNFGNVIMVQLASPIVNVVGDEPKAESLTTNSISQIKNLDEKVQELDKKTLEIVSKKDTWKEADGYLYNNSTNGVVINGTGLEGNSLIVKGGVLSKEVNVKVEGSESWPDYVFQPSYKRMSLDEVEKFITINKHLPNVPSAAEMAITGNNLGKTDIKLLEKVEELTLYLLEMKKANDAQSAELKALKMQVNSLKKNRK